MTDQPDIQAVKDYLLTLQDRICSAVEQADGQEELGLQHRGQLRLTRRAFQQLAAQHANTNTDTQCAQPDHQGYGYCGHSNYSFHYLTPVFSEFSRIKQPASTPISGVPAPWTGTRWSAS